MLERLDPTYAADVSLIEERYATPIFPLTDLGSLAEIVQYGTSERTDAEVGATPVLRIPNLQADGWQLEDLKYLNASVSDLQQYRLERGDILFNRTNGSRELVGKNEVFDFAGDWLFASYLIRLRLDRAKANPYFVSAFLNTFWGRRQVEHASRQILMSNVNSEEIRALRIPLPDLPAQDRLVADLNVARAARDAGLKAADDLLAGIDTFVLDALGLTLPPPHDPTRPFAVRFGQLVAGGKLIPDFYHPDRLHATGRIETTGSFAWVSDIAAFEREQREIGPDDFYVGLARVASHTGELTDVEEVVEGSVVTFRRGDVLFARLRPYLNKVWIADCDGVASPEFYVMRPRALIAAEYLAAILRSSLTLAQTRHLATGNTHPRVGPEDFAALLLPMGDEVVRANVAAEVDCRRAEAKRLRADARAG